MQSPSPSLRDHGSRPVATTPDAAASSPPAARRASERAEKLRAQGGWSAKSAVFWDYVDEGEKWGDAATEGICLQP
ncbi:hypothetical protein ACFWWA_15005 [Streptomyces goshikiensis]|uniref:hypothetical protein n=1 Tax=Streptomyces goshikiensis TaxID=1942 RepID=UPI0036641365